MPATEENGSTAWRSASPSTASVLMPVAALSSASRTSACSEEPLPVILTFSTAAKDESRNHNQPRTRPPSASSTPASTRQGSLSGRAMPGHSPPRAKFLPGSWLAGTDQRPAERVDVARAHREHEVAGRQAVAQQGLGGGKRPRPGHGPPARGVRRRLGYEQPRDTRE